MFTLLGFLSKCFEVSWTLGVNVVLLIANTVRPYWTPANIFVFSLTASWVIYLWETYLSYRQYKVCRDTASIPAEVTAITDQETFSKARLYQLDKSKFSFLSRLWDQLEITVILLLNGIPFLWTLSEKWASQCGLGTGELVVTSFFVVLGSVISTILGLPWSVYYTFVIEQRHGFNNQTARFFAVDKLKKFAVTQCVMVPIVAAVVQIIKIGGDYFFVYLWVFTLVLCVVMSFIYSDFIAPLFDKFTPLPEGELRSKIESLAASINFPLKKLYVVEGSKRSSHSNAYFFGLYKEKKIVLFDTLLEKDGENVSAANGVSDEKGGTKQHKKCGCNDEEILGILAHELGHWKLNHVLKNFAIGQVHLFFCFLIFAMLYQDQRLYRAFGFEDVQPVFIGLILIFMYIFLPYNTLLEFLMTALSRRFEFQADGFAKKMHRASYLRSALVKLNRDNLGFPINDWLYSAWNHSHPPTLERIRVLGRAED